jgi:integrase/recombinase XerD
MTFTDYLIQKMLSRKTILSYHKHGERFTTWLASKKMKAEEAEYSDLLNFIEYYHHQGYKKRYTMQGLTAIRHYYNYLKYTGIVKENPAAGLYLRNILRRLPHDLLTHEQMENIYNGYRQNHLAGRRNKIMLGLMIYQAVNSQELGLLEPDHLQLRKGRIIIPGTRRSNRRILKLEAHQMIDLQEYVSKTRELILSVTGKDTTWLFTSMGNGENLRNSIDKLMRHLRKKHGCFRNAGQIRQSRLAIWVKQYGLRQAQYMVGHKYVSSTERYQTNHLEDLQKEMDKYYPGHE